MPPIRLQDQQETAQRNRRPAFELDHIEHPGHAAPVQQTHRKVQPARHIRQVQYQLNPQPAITRRGTRLSIDIASILRRWHRPDDRFQLRPSALLYTQHTLRERVLGGYDCDQFLADDENHECICQEYLGETGQDFCALSCWTWQDADGYQCVAYLF
jgi:hypothetical protein